MVQTLWIALAVISIVAFAIIGTCVTYSISQNHVDD